MYVIYSYVTFKRAGLGLDAKIEHLKVPEILELLRKRKTTVLFCEDSEVRATYL